LDLDNINWAVLFTVLAGFLIGTIPAFFLFGFLLSRRYEEQRAAMQLACQRQLTALRETLRRAMGHVESLADQRDALQHANRDLREAVRDQHAITDRTSHELEEAQQNMVRLQERVDELQAENLRHEGRLEQARLHEERMTAQVQKTMDQVLQTERLQRNLLFATSQLREAQVSTAALEAKLRQGIRPVGNGDTVAAEQMDVGLIDGLEPQYAQRLHDSGIHTIGDLARQTPARVAHFAGLENWDDSAAWIAEAKLRLANASDGPAA
jgi:predicted flap endonuclease-1-like 5' DNA nuclease